MNSLKYINILLLGETGVGKSTFINAFANYIMYESLMVAECNPLISIIPSSFTMTNDNYEEIEIKIGQDECFPPGQSSTNENFVNGQSSTQKPKAYSFSYGDKIINLIDTPGIGDSRGIDQDKKNFDTILQFISNYKEIHGICILLKPNTRLTATFRFCIKEFLAHLHQSVAQNIVFCFTNSRSTFYRPGDTLPTLKNLLAHNPDVKISLAKHTIYCMDNESFRFLAAQKKGVYFTEEDRQDYAVSWARSGNETGRLLAYIQTLKPHKFKDALSLNEARSLIVNLSKPIARIPQNIQVSNAVVEDKKKEIELLNAFINDLQKKMYIRYSKLEARLLDYPRVVCTSPCCIDVVDKEGVSTINYKTHCLERYYSKDVYTNTTNNVALKNCSAMDNNGNCKMCGCPWHTHMYITYETFQVLTNTNIINANIQNQIKTKEDRKREIEKFIQTLNEQIRKLKNEQEIIIKVCAKLAFFLKHNAISAYNDALGSYLEHLMLEEENKIGAGRGDKTLLGLEKLKRDYDEQVKILEDAMNDKGGQQVTIAPDDISKLKKELFALEINGKELQDVMG